jgi:L-ascorbate metabolism protein UlaG (beta-lactamase superfamily)
MNAVQAAEACRAIKPRTAVPYHWGDIVGTETDARSFVDATAGCDPRLLQPGEAISV